MKNLFKLVALAALLGFSGVVSAADMDPTTCTTDVTVNDETANSCGTDSDNDNAAQANENFPLTDDEWILGARYDDTDFESNDIGVEFEPITSGGELVGGTFSIPEFYDPLLIVIKGGTQDAVYYLFDPVSQTTSCVGTAPAPICGTTGNLALIGPQGQLQNISHISWYVTESSQVPEPGALGLLGLGLLGLGIARRRKVAG